MAAPTTDTPKGEFLLEVRSEEIPARMLEPGTRELATRVFEELMARGVGPREVETGYTPRRLVLILSGLPEREADREEQVLGPPVRAAYNAEGAPTPALLGFAKRCGVAPEELIRIATEKGEYLAAKQHTLGRATREILSELIPRVLAGISWPKAMRWGAGDGPWVRPVQGLLALLDGNVVPMTFFGVAASDSTIGHPILSPESFSVAGAADYRKKLTALGIEVRHAARRERLHAAMTAEAEALGGKLVEDDPLLDKLAALCEIPGVMSGAFDPAFLSLPAEVLATSLRDHQSALTVEGPEGLMPAFLTVMDRPDDPVGRVRSGNEYVVAARLADAKFFYGEDRKGKLAPKASRLASLGFHERLGTYGEKAERLARLAAAIGRRLGSDPQEVEQAVEAAKLLKVDLTTEMVKEFTSLQGIVGGIYAREDGHPEAVWQAIYDQYQPASTEDSIPRGRVGRIAGLADRIDTLVGIFGLGLIPTGSKDPFGLRRAAQGVVRIALEGSLSIDLEAVAREAVGFYGTKLSRPADEVLGLLRPFLHDRIRHVLGLEGYAYDEIEAALGAGAVSLPDLRARVAALKKVRGEERFLSVVLSAKRIANIVKDAPEHDLEPGALVEPAERELFDAFAELRAEIVEALAERDYERVLFRTADLAPVLDKFFVDVLVMDPDPEVRANRIALLQAIHRTISRTAKLTEMVVDKAELRGR
jgi:glycyl-tRNA synthetase beta chain